MVVSLSPSEYPRAASLFQNNSGNLSVDCLLHGTCPGVIYTENKDTPQTGFLLSSECTMVGGIPSDDLFNRELNQLIHNEEEWDILYCLADPAWKPHFPRIFHGMHWFPAMRFHLTCQSLRIPAYRAALPAGFSLHPVDATFLSSPVAKPAHLTNWITNNWTSEANYLHQAWGMCLMHGDRVVCWSLLDCHLHDACEIGIHTDPEYRKEGCATLTVAAMVEHCLQQGIRQIGWHCDVENIGSRKTAEKVGFRIDHEYTQYLVFKDRTRMLIEHGLKLAKHPHYTLPQRRTLLAPILQELTQIPDPPTHWSIPYKIACMYALLEKIPQTWTWLHRVIATVAESKEAILHHMRFDEDLQVLRHTPAWDTFFHSS